MTPTSGLCVALRTARHLYVLAGCPSYQPRRVPRTACLSCSCCAGSTRAALPAQLSAGRHCPWRRPAAGQRQPGSTLVPGHRCPWLPLAVGAVPAFEQHGLRPCFAPVMQAVARHAVHCRGLFPRLLDTPPNSGIRATQPTNQPALLDCPLRAAAERLFPWLLDWIADSSALPAAEALSQLRKIAHQLLVSGRLVGQLGVVLSVACRCKCTDGPARHSTAGAAAGRSCYSAHSHVLGVFVIKRHTCLGLMHLLQPKASISARCALCRWRLLSCTTAAW